MQEMPPDFIGHISRSMAVLLNAILREDGLHLFRRHPQVVLGAPEMVSSSDFCLNLTGFSTSEGDKGSFNCETQDHRFIVFRNPSRMTLSFALTARGLSATQQHRAYDKLLSYFFDHRAIDPFVPDSMRRFLPVYEKLISGKAELKINEMGISPTPRELSSELFTFSFSYLALYHSGNPLREEVKTKKRVVDLLNENSERSVL